MTIRNLLPLFALGLCLALPSRADLVLYDVTANLSAFSGADPGSLVFGLNSFGAPDYNVIAYISGFSSPGSDLGTPTASPQPDVFQSGSAITLGGTSLDRLFTIPVNTFGNSVTFSLSLDRQAGGSTDGWTFFFTAQDDQGTVFDGLSIDVGPDGEPSVFNGEAFNATVVPEPRTYLLLAASVAALIYRARRL